MKCDSNCEELLISVRLLFSWSLLYETDVSQSNFTASVIFNIGNMLFRHWDFIIHALLLVKKVTITVLLRLNVCDYLL